MGEYDQEIPHSHTANERTAQRGRTTNDINSKVCAIYNCQVQILTIIKITTLNARLFTVITQQVGLTVAVIAGLEDIKLEFIFKLKI